MVVAKCAKVDGPTDAPITTETPCVDKWSNCAAMAEEKCYQTEIGEECPKSCGKCPGETNSVVKNVKLWIRRHPGSIQHLLQPLHQLRRPLQVRPSINMILLPTDTILILFFTSQNFHLVALTIFTRAVYMCKNYLISPRS